VPAGPAPDAGPREDAAAILAAHVPEPLPEQRWARP
jgi:hypothetical protein